MKIALLKQDVLPDLYVAGPQASPLETLHSSMMRVGPIGLLTELGADFYIIREADAPECRAWVEIIATPGPDRKEDFRALKDTPINQLKGQSHKVPGSSDTHDRYAVAFDAVDWSQYDIVISINFAIPTHHLQRFPQVLWCYMVMEANAFMDKVYFGYDVSLNQEARGIVGRERGILDFPYTFVGPETLAQLTADHEGRPSAQSGIFIDATSINERPIRSAPGFEPLQETGHPLRLHQQRISDNLRELYDAKYYVKMGGRPTRGNGVIEAISSGTLVLMSPDHLTYTQLLPKETWVESLADIRAKIEYLDQHPEEYDRLLGMQRQLLQHFVYDCPLRSLVNAYQAKKDYYNQAVTPSESTKHARFRWLARPVRAAGSFLNKAAIKLEYW